MKKEEVFVVIDSKKVAKKVAKVLEMFNESVFSSPNHNDENQNGKDECFKYGFSCGSWQGKNLKHWCYRNIEHKEVSVSELKQILAIEHLKKGDACIMGIDDLKWLVVFERMRGDYFEGYYMHFGSKFMTSFTGGFDKFIRYATEEEKQLLNPGAKEDEKHTGSFESLRKCDSVDFPNDFKELTSDDYNGKWVVIDCHQYRSPKGTARDAIVYFNSSVNSFGFDYEGCFTNDFYTPNNEHNIKRLATQEEVSERFLNESHRRYPNKIGFIFNHTTNEITAGGEIVFKNGTWLEAKKIEIDPFKELKEAHKKGFEIEYKSSSGQWKTSSNPAWRKTGNYRIRPVKIGDWFFTTHEQTNVKYYYQVNETNINDVKPNHVRILNQMVIDILNNGKYTV